MGGGGGSPISHVKQVKLYALACKTNLAKSVTHFCGFALRSHTFSLHVLIVCTYFTIISASEPHTHNPDLPSPSKPFSVIIVGFVIHKNVSTSEPFAQYLVPKLDSSKSLADYICQVYLAAHPSLVYYKNDIKAVQMGQGSVSYSCYS